MMYPVPSMCMLYLATLYIHHSIYHQQYGWDGVYSISFFLLANMWQAMISACCVAFRVYLVYGPPQNSVVDTWPPPPLYVNPLARLSPYASGIAVHFALSDCQEGQSGGTWRRPLGVGRVGESVKTKWISRENSEQDLKDRLLNSMNIISPSCVKGMNSMRSQPRCPSPNKRL